MSVERRTFWNAWAEGRLLLQRCASCGTARFYPKPFCPSCGAAAHEWVAAEGGGEIHSWTAVHRRSGHVPAMVVLVTLDEGVRVLGVLDGAGEPGIGERVRLAPRRAASGPIRFARAALQA